MPTANAVATELRKLADSLDQSPDSAIPTPYLCFSRDYGKDDKDRFLSIARLMPRPIKKEYTDRELRLEYRSESITVSSRIDRSEVCTLVEPARPAVYDCVPLLSIEEDAQLAQEVL